MGRREGTLRGTYAWGSIEQCTGRDNVHGGRRSRVFILWGASVVHYQVYTVCGFGVRSGALSCGFITSKPRVELCRICSKQVDRMRQYICQDQLLYGAFIVLY